MNLCIFSFSVFIFPSLVDSDLLCVLLVYCIAWTKSGHAIWRTQIQLKLSSSSPPATFPGRFFPLWAVWCLRAFAAARWNTWHFWITDKAKLGALLLPICPKLRIRKDSSLLMVMLVLTLGDCSVQGQESDSAILVGPFQLNRLCDSVHHLHRPSVQAAGVWRSWVKTWKESKVSICLCNSWWEQCDVTLSRVTVLMYLWTWARGRKAVRQPLVRSFSLQSSRFLKGGSHPTRHERCWVRMYSLCSAGLQTGEVLWAFAYEYRKDTLWKVLYAGAFNRWGKRKPKLSASSSLLPFQMPPMVASTFLGRKKPFPLRACGLEACSGDV